MALLVVEELVDTHVTHKRCVKSAMILYVKSDMYYYEHKCMESSRVLLFLCDVTLYNPTLCHIHNRVYTQGCGGSGASHLTPATLKLDNLLDLPNRLLPAG